MRQRFNFLSAKLDAMDGSGEPRTAYFYRRRNDLLEQLDDLQDDIEMRSGRSMLPLNLNTLRQSRIRF